MNRSVGLNIFIIWVTVALLAGCFWLVSRMTQPDDDQNTNPTVAGSTLHSQEQK